MQCDVCRRGKTGSRFSEARKQSSRTTDRRIEADGTQRRAGALPRGNVSFREASLAVRRAELERKRPEIGLLRAETRLKKTGVCPSAASRKKDKAVRI